MSSTALGIAGIFQHKIESYNWVMVNESKHVIFVERTHGIVGHGPILEFGAKGEVVRHMMPQMSFAMKNPSLIFLRSDHENG